MNGNLTGDVTTLTARLRVSKARYGGAILSEQDVDTVIRLADPDEMYVARRIGDYLRRRLWAELDREPGSDDDLIATVRNLAQGAGVVS